MKLNTIYNEDCLRTMKRMPDNFIDLVITSPPYDNMRNYTGYAFDFENITKELFRVIKEGGVVVWVVGDSVVDGSETGTSFRQALFFKEIGFKLHDTMIYKKNSSSFPSSTRYYACFEYMFVFVKGKLKCFNPIQDHKNKHAGGILYPWTREKDGILRKGSRYGFPVKDVGVRFNVWEYATGCNNSYSEDYLKVHPAIFPEKLAEDHIISWSNAGDLVYDPFMGSGTTAKMAIIQQRFFIGSEISCEYVLLANKRIKEFKWWK